jgi:hypothetical protein
VEGVGAAVAVTGVAMDVRPAAEAEIGHLAKIWHESWHDAHARIVPAELTRLRTLESFEERLRAALPDLRVVGPPGEPVGFCVVQGNERAAKFYEKRGWRRAGTMINLAETSTGPFPLEVWRYEKSLTRPA